MALTRQDATIFQEVSSSSPSSSRRIGGHTEEQQQHSSPLTLILSVDITDCESNTNKSTSDEGSPASQASLASEDFIEHHQSSICSNGLILSSGCTLASPDVAEPAPAFVPPEGWEEMIIRQRDERRAELKTHLMNWVVKCQEEMFKNLPGELRLPTLICEAHRYEKNFILAHRKHLTEERVAYLLADNRRCYTNILTEVKRAVKSNPPAAQQQLTVEQHRHNVANSGAQCFAAMLPYSNGLCGAITDARRAHASTTRQVPEHILKDEEFHDLHAVPSSSSSNSPTKQQLPKGLATGLTGRLIPVSMSADHGKGDKVSTFRRKNLAAKKASSSNSGSAVSSPSSSGNQQQHAYRTPQFARTRIPASQKSTRGFLKSQQQNQQQNVTAQNTSILATASYNPVNTATGYQYGRQGHCHAGVYQQQQHCPRYVDPSRH